MSDDRGAAGRIPTDPAGEGEAVSSDEALELAEEAVTCRAEGRWRDLAALLEPHLRFAEAAVNRFRVETDEGWQEAVRKLQLMGFLPRGLQAEARAEVVEELKGEIREMDEQMSLNDGRLVAAGRRLPPLTAIYVDERLAQVNARLTESRIMTPLDGEESRYKIFYRHFDSGSKMDVYEPAGVVLMEEGRYRQVPASELPERVGEIFRWFASEIVVKAVRLDDPHARKLNSQVDEGYMVAAYGLGPHPSFVNTTYFRSRPDAASDRPAGVSLVLQETRFRGAGRSELRPVYVGQEGMVVVVQRRAPSTIIDVVLRNIRKAADEGLVLVDREIEEADHILNRLSARGRSRIRGLRAERKRLQGLWNEERQYLVGAVYRRFQDFLAKHFGLRDMDADFERNYSLQMKSADHDLRRGTREAVSHVVAFDFDQFRPLKGFARSQGRLPDVFEQDAPEALRRAIRRAQVRALL